MRRLWICFFVLLFSWSLVVQGSGLDVWDGLDDASLDDIDPHDLSMDGYDFDAYVVRNHLTSRSLVKRQDTNVTFNPPPSQDPWYSPPAGWDSLPPGTVLKIRPNAFPSGNINNSFYTFQILYSTLDTHGDASWSVSTTWIPMSAWNCTQENQTSACSPGIVTYLIPYDTADKDACPSYGLQFGEPYGEMSDLLARNWFVMAPDYEGPNASYCSGPQAGYATLDAVKTVLQVAPIFNLNVSMKAGVWGYSGGALAAAFAAELAASHTPDTPIAGIVYGGTAPNLTTATQLMNTQDTAGLFVAALLGITSQYPEAKEWMLSQMYEEGQYNVSNFLTAMNMSGSEVLPVFAFQDVYEYFLNGSLDISNPILLDIFNSDGMLGYHGTPNMPVFAYKAIQDEMSPVNETDDLIAKYCNDGANILYQRNTIGTHNVELWTGRPRVIEFLHTVLENEKMLPMPTSGCEIMNVTIDIFNIFPGILKGNITLGWPANGTNDTFSSIGANSSIWEECASYWGSWCPV